jgi:hypothetical protein
MDLTVTDTFLCNNTLKYVTIFNGGETSSCFCYSAWNEIKLEEFTHHLKKGKYIIYIIYLYDCAIIDLLSFKYMYTRLDLRRYYYFLVLLSTKAKVFDFTQVSW